VARFDEPDEFLEFAWFPNKTVAVQSVDRTNELGIIGTRRDHNRDVHQLRGGFNDLQDFQPGNSGLLARARSAYASADQRAVIQAPSMQVGNVGILAVVPQCA
jgi:hypothetical protein